MSFPPAPIWDDTASGLAVWVNGGCVELTVPDGWSGRLSPAEASALVEGLSSAVTVANSWAARWDSKTQTYGGVNG